MIKWLLRKILADEIEDEIFEITAKITLESEVECKEMRMKLTAQELKLRSQHMKLRKLVNASSHLLILNKEAPLVSIGMPFQDLRVANALYTMKEALREIRKDD